MAPKKTKAKRQTKKRVAARARVPTQFGVPHAYKLTQQPTQITNLHRTAQGLCDPFGDAAIGVKTPSDGTPNTFWFRGVTYSYEDSLADSGTPAGMYTSPMAAFSINATLANEVYYAASIANSVVTWATVKPNGAYTDLSSLVGKYRIVSWGVRVYYMGDPTKAKGTVFLCTGTGGVQAKDTVATGSTMNLNDFESSIALPVAGLDALWVSDKVDNRADEFVDLATTIASATPCNAWTGLSIVVVGCDTTANGFKLGIEVVKNIEALPATSSILGSMATPNPGDDPRATLIHRRVRQTIPDVHAGSKDSFAGKVWTMVKGAASDVARAGLNFVAPQMGAMANRLLDGYARPRYPSIMEVD